VVSKDLENNLLWVAQGDDHPALYSTEAQVGGLTWVAERPPLAEGESLACTAKYRYRQGDQRVTVRLAADGLRVTAEEAQRAVTPGQSLVLYQGEVCLGGGIIERAW